MTDPWTTSPADPDSAVRSRYSAAAQQREGALCCPVEYDPRLLEVIPEEVLERDYGCGDPSRFVRPGDTVLDLGSGGGKICFIAAQQAGAKGRVIGVDQNADMLALARRAAPVVAERLGYANVEFRRGSIQDLALDADRLDAWLAEHPVRTLADLALLDERSRSLRERSPLVADASIDLVVSNCVLNLVRESDKAALIREIHRVLRPGGRIAISDIVSDEPVPAHLRADPELWSGCVSGAFEERALLDELEQAGFHGIAIESFEQEPFAVVEGIEFRSVTVTAHRGEAGPAIDAGHAVVYRGPWRQVEDDEGQVLRRGERTAVSDRSFRRLMAAPYADQLVSIEPRVAPPQGEAKPFDRGRAGRRDPRETKGGSVAATCPGESCC